MGVRVSSQLRGEILKWAETQPDKLTLSEATRRLIEIGLKAPRPPAKVIIKPAHKTRAAELAAQAMDGLIESNVSPDERDRRRSPLTRGPLEFRGARVDQNK
jgi:hypothetical protein